MNVWRHFYGWNIINKHFRTAIMLSKKENFLAIFVIIRWIIMKSFSRHINRGNTACGFFFYVQDCHIYIHSKIIIFWKKTVNIGFIFTTEDRRRCDAVVNCRLVVFLPSSQVHMKPTKGCFAGRFILWSAAAHCCSCTVVVYADQWRRYSNKSECYNT